MMRMISFIRGGTTMKKTVFFIVATWFACTVVSCEKRESPASEGIQKEVTIGCYTEVADVKTSLSGNDTEGYSVVWSTGDKVRTRSVSGSGNTKLDKGYAITLVPSYAGKTYAKFTGTITPADDATAFEAQYPAYYPEGTSLSVTAQNGNIGSQHYKPGSPDFMPMFAREEEAEPEQLHFSNLMGVIRLDLHNNGTTDYRVKGISYTASPALMGNWNNVLQEDGHYMAVYRTGAKPLTLDCGEEGVVVPAGGTMQFFVSALPKEYADFGFTITNTEDKVVEVKMKAGKTFQVTRSRISTVSLPVEASAFVRPVAANEIIYTTSDGKKIDIYAVGDNFPVKGTKSASDSFVTVSAHEFDSETSTGIITFASNVTVIGFQAFKGKSTITDVRFSNAVTYIGEEAFMDCTGLQAIKLPNSVVTIQARAFQGCAHVESAVIGRVTSLSQSAFQDCTSLKKIDLPSSLVKINSSVFYGCTSLETIVIPDSITDLPGGGIFRDCTALNSIDMGNGTYTTIPGTTFKGCTSLTEITIPASVTTIGNHAFNGCSNLATIRFKRSASATAPAAESSATFYGCKNPGVIIVPDGCLEAYVAAWRVGTTGTDYVPKYITIREETSGKTE